MKASGIQNNEELVNPSRPKLKKKRGEKGLPLVGNQEQRKIIANGIRQTLKPTLWENKEQRKVNVRGSQNNEGMVDPSHQNLKQMVGGNQISDQSMKSKSASKIWSSGSGPGKAVFERLDSQNPSTNLEQGNMNASRPKKNRGEKGLLLVGNREQRKINANEFQNNEELVNSSRQSLRQTLCEKKEQRKVHARGSQRNGGMVENNEQRKVSARGRKINEGMVNPSHKKLNQKAGENQISDNSMKSKNASRIWYAGSGPGKAVFESLDSQNQSTYHEDNVTMENLYHEDHQEHEVNSPQTNTVTNAHHQENIASSSNGTTITRKESRALSANRKSKYNQRKLVFEIDDCAGRIVGDDSQIFITKGGCVVRECAAFDGRTWKKQDDLLKEDIISKTTEHSNFQSTCPLLTRAIKTQLATHHRTRQYTLHKHYLKYSTKEEAMTHPPNGVKVAEWVLLCDRFASEEFQKLSAINKQNRACNEVPPTVGTKSVVRRIHNKRKRGKEVTAIGGYKIAHWSKKKKAMINEKATEIWSDLQNEEASSSCTPAEICIEKLGHIPGHIRGRSASTKHVFETESIRMDLNSEKEKSKQLEKDHLELKEKHLKLQEDHVSLTKKVNYLLKHFPAWQSQENEDYDTEEDYDAEEYDEAKDGGM